MEPSLADVIAFVRKFSGCRRENIDENTCLEKDLGITGDDGVELLEEAEKVFGVSFFAEEDEFRKAFSLQENEYLFHSEGIDFLGIVYLCRRLRGIPAPVIRDLSVGQLHSVLVEARNKKERVAL
ncbi:hypothetical protein [Pantoea vagans]|uniref:hypothetical protein n=1 Tax=Pantoea vagans TaxID=470934 RepID=UPI0023B0270A|nr:hypothetical protein [Pantoea vagans]MDE8556371.1 hypothetical protein [Pantoea vagans]MDE8576422.1 hypothetical protein [Pantoea vagans]